jgi:ATP-dependent DNA helicase RecQ
VLCTTATANKRVVGDISVQLGTNLKLIRGSLDRETLSLRAVEIPSTIKRLAWLPEHIPRLEGSGIVYCLTVADTERVADLVRHQRDTGRLFAYSRVDRFGSETRG